ncbi:MAG: hypothetical protein ACKO23_19610, partial [Gemmataceae bacterium]
MRWSIVWLLFQRELLDQLRDRRTVFMIVFLPVLLVPLAGTALSRLASGLFPKNVVVGVAGLDDSLTARTPAGWTPEIVAACVTPSCPSPGIFLESSSRIVSFFAPHLAAESARSLISQTPSISMDPGGMELVVGGIIRYLDSEHRGFPPLLESKDGHLAFREVYLPKIQLEVAMEIRPISGIASGEDKALESFLLEESLQNRGLDALV